MNDDTELFYARYEATAAQILQTYLSRYFKEHPSDRGIETAKAFMDAHYDAYRRDVARLAVDIMHESGMGNNELNLRIINQNSWTIGALAGEIIKDAMTLKS